MTLQWQFKNNLQTKFYENKEINEKLRNIDVKTDQPEKGNNLLWSRLSVAVNTSALLSKNHQKHTEKNDKTKKKYT